MTDDEKLMQQALDMLKQAKDSVAGWGAYASEYFQHKHNLQGSIDDIQAQITVLSERLAQPEQDWDWRHPKAQALIGAKARLEIKLRLVEQLVEDPNFETTASDMEYWEPLHDKLQGRLAQPGQEPFALLVRKHSWNEGQYECAPPNAPEYGRQWADERVLVYTSPPQRKPLTDDEIADLWGAPLTNTTDLKPVKDFVRDIEAAHGIKE